MKQPTLKQIEAKKKELELKRHELVLGLPHLYGHKWYWWQRQFFETRNRMVLMTCGNQVGKSVCHIWRKVQLATNVEAWPELWQEVPNLFWFFYTDQDTLNREFDLKWRRWLPQGEYKKHPKYGWEVEATKNGREIHAIRFNSGVLLEFKLYTQNPKNLQSATVFDVGGDEEMPVSFWDEIIQRISGPDGYFSMAFTATLNQQLWWRAMEAKGDQEKFPDAFKLQVSKYDCTVFDDGTPGLYTKERIDKQASELSSQSQIDKRIDGKFAAESGRKYHAFDPSRHYVKPFKIPVHWPKYVGVDIGAGGEKNHPAAIYFIAVQPDYRKGYVYKGWRGDDEQTTSGDVLTKFIKLRGSDILVEQRYDYHSKDFGTIAERSGEPFLMADKSHERGEEVINTLFSNDMLMLFDDDPEIQKVGSEMLTLMKDTDKRSAVDDGIDATRYGCVTIPWDWTAIQGRPTDDQVAEAKAALAARPLTKEEQLADQIRARRGDPTPKEANDWSEFEDEIAFWNEQLGT